MFFRLVSRNRSINFNEAHCLWFEIWCCELVVADERGLNASKKFLSLVRGTPAEVLDIPGTSFVIVHCLKVDCTGYSCCHFSALQNLCTNQSLQYWYPKP
jgi:hypothetical protein